MLPHTRCAPVLSTVLEDAQRITAIPAPKKCWYNGRCTIKITYSLLHQFQDGERITRNRIWDNHHGLWIDKGGEKSNNLQLNELQLSKYSDHYVKLKLILNVPLN